MSLLRRKPKTPHVVSVPVPAAAPPMPYSDKTYEVLGELTSLTTRLNQAVKGVEVERERLHSAADRLEGLDHPQRREEDGGKGE